MSQQNFNADIGEFYGYDGQDLLLQDALQRKDELEMQEFNTGKTFILRKLTLETYFIRMSWTHKFRFLLELLQEISSADTLDDILNIIYPLYDKLETYMIAMPDPGLPNHRILKDHDRMLDEITLQKSIKQDKKWFATLVSYKQISIVISLLIMMGGNAIAKLYFPLKIICKNRQMTQTKPVDHADEIGTDRIDTQDFDASHPLSVEVEKQRKNWDDLMAKYRRDIEAQSGVEEVKGSLETKHRKVNELKKPKRPSKRLKMSKIVTKHEIDWVQLLPVWVVKQIFGYLEESTLQKIKSVNMYWSYIVDEVKKDANARKQLNDALQKLSVQLDPELLETYGKLPRVSSVGKKMSAFDKRMTKQMERGAILDKLRPQPQDRYVETSLLTAALHDRMEEYTMPVEKLTTFPRILRYSEPLYRKESCQLLDLNILIQDQQMDAAQKICGDFIQSDDYQSGDHDETGSILSTELKHVSLSDW